MLDEHKGSIDRLFMISIPAAVIALVVVPLLVLIPGGFMAAAVIGWGVAGFVIVMSLLMWLAPDSRELAMRHALCDRCKPIYEQYTNGET